MIVGRQLTKNKDDNAFVGFSLALYARYRTSRSFSSSKKAALRVMLPLIILMIIFMILNVYVLGLPMSPRHGH